MFFPGKRSRNSRPPPGISQLTRIEMKECWTTEQRVEGAEGRWESADKYAATRAFTPNFLTVTGGKWRPGLFRQADMVKLGSNLADKLDKEQSMDDGFDNIPLITPLEVNQLQQPYLDKVIVKTTTEYQLQQKKKKKLYVPGIKKLNIKLYDEVSEKVKLTGLILITLGFLACLLLLVMYKALWYNQLTCPEGFVLKHKHCTPAAVLEPWYYTEQQQQEDPGVPPRSSSLYTALGHLNQAKRTAAGAIIPELPPSPWFPVINALKQAERAKEEASRSKE